MLDHAIREVPHDIEAEQAFLGSILAKNTALDGLASFNPEDLYDPIHAAMFAAMRAQWQDKRAVNLATLRGYVEKFPDINEGLSAIQYLRKLIELGDARNVDGLAAHLSELAVRRQLCALADSLNAAARDQAHSVAELASVASESINDVLAIVRGRKRTNYDFSEAVGNFLDAAMNNTGEGRITTGLKSLDDATGGWRRKQFAIIAGRPSMGKTTVATSAMLRTASKGHGVLCFSLEMPADALAARALSDLSWSRDFNIPYSAAMSRKWNKREEDRICRAASDFNSLPLVIDDQRGLTVAEIGARARQQAQKFEKMGKRLGLVVVDHLGLVRPSGRYSGNRVQEVAEISDGLATMAKDLDVAVVALCQLNRGTEGRENKRPTLADLRDSGSLEQDADVVCFAYREAYYLERMKCEPGSLAEDKRKTELEAFRNSLELMIAKNRNGPTMSLDLFCDMACNAIRDAQS